MVEAVQRRGDVTALVVRADRVATEAEVGDSISVNGVCLTVTHKREAMMSFDLSQETLRTTNLGSLRRGDVVNLEPSLRPTDRLGGHIVTGHVDAVGVVRGIRRIGETMEMEIQVPREVGRYLVKKGSVAVDGISLTVVDVGEESFRVVIIPHTARVTNIGQRRQGDRVNIETDILGKYVERFLSPGQGDERLMERLKEGGFL